MTILQGGDGTVPGGLFFKGINCIHLCPGYHAHISMSWVSKKFKEVLNSDIKTTVSAILMFYKSQAINLKGIIQLLLMLHPVESLFKNNWESVLINVQSGARGEKEAKWSTGLQTGQEE